MTLHGAKGLEFDTVFLPGWEEGLFPNQRALDEGGDKGAGGGAAARLCRPDPRAPARHRQPCREPAHLRQLAEQHPQPLHRRTAGGACGARPARRRWRAMRGSRRPRIFAGQFPLVARRPRVIEAWEQPAPSGADRGDPGGRAGVSPEIRLRHGDGGGGRQAGHRVRPRGDEAGAGSVRRAGVRPTATHRPR